MNSKKIAYLQMAGSIALLIAGIIFLAIFVFPHNPVMGFSAFIVTLVLHVPQLPKALKIGREKDLSTMRIVFKTIFLGASWWKPLEKGVIDK
jgi:hypothetical protein